DREPALPGHRRPVPGPRYQQGPPDVDPFSPPWRPQRWLKCLPDSPWQRPRSLPAPMPARQPVGLPRPGVPPGAVPAPAPPGRPRPPVSSSRPPWRTEGPLGSPARQGLEEPVCVPRAPARSRTMADRPGEFPRSPAPRRPCPFGAPPLGRAPPSMPLSYAPPFLGRLAHRGLEDGEAVGGQLRQGVIEEVGL